MSIVIKFRTPVFLKGKFHHFSYWGVGVPKGAVFSMPPSLSIYTQKDHQQYTGLKDKSGVEIYEGDIYWMMESYCPAGEKFTGEMIMVAVEYEVAGLQPRDVYERNGKRQWRHWELMQEGEYEVIGNIHKNPELLRIAPES